MFDDEGRAVGERALECVRQSEAQCERRLFQPRQR